MTAQWCVPSTHLLILCSCVDSEVLRDLPTVFNNNRLARLADLRAHGLDLLQHVEALLSVRVLGFQMDVETCQLV